MSSVGGVRPRPSAAGLREHLTVALRENLIPVGGRLPTEKALMDQFSLSRTTVRKVLRDLEMEGLIERQQGRGTFRTAGRRRAGRLWLTGVWFNWLGGPHWGPMIEGIRDEMAHARYHCVFEVGGLNAGDEDRGIASLVRKDLDGFIVAPSSNPDDDHAPLIELIERRVPLVLIERALPGYDVDLVTTYHELGAEECVSFLFEMGHRRIAYFGIEGLRARDGRLVGYTTAMARHDLRFDPEWIKVHPRVTLSGAPNLDEEQWITTVAGTRVERSLCRRSVRELISLPAERRPTAVFAINTTLAEFLIEELSQHGLRVPEDLSVVAFGEAGHPERHEPESQLTTYAQPNYALGQQAARLLIQRMDAPAEPRRTVLLQGRLHVGASTRPIA
ncbi:GntR family transcriptional regulator [bacterium]|nr:GntR family transcriptional regulator [bacterium]